MGSADPRRGVAGWLDDARRVFAARIGHLLAASTPTGVDSIMHGFVATDDARTVARALETGAPDRPEDPPDVRAAADRLADPGALAGLPVAHLLDRFALPADVAPVLALLAVAETDMRFATLFAYLNDDAQRRHATPALVDRLAGPLPWAPVDWLASDAPLTVHRIVELGAGPDRMPGDRPLRLTDHVGRRLTSTTGAPPPDPVLSGYLQDVPRAPLDVLVPDARCRRRLLNAAAAPLSVLTGPDGSGRTVVAAALAEAGGRRVLTVDGTAVAVADDPVGLLRTAVREATWDAATLVVTGAGALPQPVRTNAFAAAPCPVVLVAPGRLDLEVPQAELPRAGTRAAAGLWRYLLGPSRSEVADELAYRFRLPPAQIIGIARAEPDAGPERLAAACVERSSTALDALATRVEVHHGWDDLILPARQVGRLRELVGRAVHARTVYDGWGFGRRLAPGGGLTAMFSGPSGAGKTLSAGIVAGELGLPLYRVDLSATVSKYIGETEKNLDRIFAAAEAGNACLFFDECDALFGKRSEVSDAHDRYANIETSFLLQRLETHHGIVILASNLPQNIDEAFARRIDVTVEFPLPDAAHRRRLWRTLLPCVAGAVVDDELLGDRFELSGGTIRNCLLTAAFLAAAEGVTIGTDHCVRAVAREYEKSGRPLTRAEFGSAFGALRPRDGGRGGG